MLHSPFPFSLHPQPLPMTLQPLSLKKWTLFPHHWNLGWPWDLLWPTEWSRSNGVLVPNLGLEKHCVFSLILLLIYPHHENVLRMEMRYMNRNEPPHSPQLKPSRSAILQPTTSYMSDWAKNSPKGLTWRFMSYINTHSFKIPSFGVVCYTEFCDNRELNMYLIQQIHSWNFPS